MNVVFTEYIVDGSTQKIVRRHTHETFVFLCANEVSWEDGRFVEGPSVPSALQSWAFDV